VDRVYLDLRVDLTCVGGHVLQPRGGAGEFGVSVDLDHEDSPRRRPRRAVAGKPPDPPQCKDRRVRAHFGEHRPVHVILGRRLENRRSGAVVGRGETGTPVGVRTARGEGVFRQRLAVQYVHHEQCHGVHVSRAELGQQIDLRIGEPDALRQHRMSHRPAQVRGAVLGKPTATLRYQSIRKCSGQSQ